MAIQWFPGHMNAAKKKIAENLRNIDVVVELLDARLPKASSNPLIQELREFRQRPALKILNKTDLADPKITTLWLDYFKQNGCSAIDINAKQKTDLAKILKLAQQLAPHRNSAVKPLRLMMLGVPNVGKSTLLNALTNKKIAAVGNEPAITKMVQRIDANSQLIIYDTPGLMWNKIADENDGFKLAASHILGVNSYDVEEVALYLAKYLLKDYFHLLKNRYKLTNPFDDNYLQNFHENSENISENFYQNLVENNLDVQLLEQIAIKRGCKTNGKIDFTKAANVFLQDYRSGVLGKISLEIP